MNKSIYGFLYMDKDTRNLDWVSIIDSDKEIWVFTIYAFGEECMIIQI